MFWLFSYLFQVICCFDDSFVIYIIELKCFLIYDTTLFQQNYKDQPVCMIICISINKANLPRRWFNFPGCFLDSLGSHHPVGGLQRIDVDGGWEVRSGRQFLTQSLCSGLVKLEIIHTTLQSLHQRLLFLKPETMFLLYNKKQTNFIIWIIK